MVEGSWGEGNAPESGAGPSLLDIDSISQDNFETSAAAGLDADIHSPGLLTVPDDSLVPEGTVEDTGAALFAEVAGTHQHCCTCPCSVED